MLFQEFVEDIKKDDRWNFDIESNDGVYYVYRVTCLKDDMYYYGSRKSKTNDAIKDFWTYCTSSKRAKDIKKNPHNYKVKIIKCFNNKAICSLYESFLHLKFDVRNNKKFFNEWNAPIFDFSTREHIVVKGANGKGKLIHIDEYNRDIHERFADRTGFTVVKDNDNNTFSISTSDPRYNTTLFNVNKEKVTVTLSENPGEFFIVDKDEFYANRDKYLTSTQLAPMTEEKRKNYSKSALNRKKITCPHCIKEGQSPNMKRWHFDNCKEKPGNENLVRVCPNKAYPNQ